MYGAVILKIPTAAEIEFFCTADVAVAEVMQANGNLNQPLIKAPVRTLRIGPQLLPNLVGLKEVARVEVLDTFQITRVVATGGHLDDRLRLRGIECFLHPRLCRNALKLLHRLAVLEDDDCWNRTH